MRLIEDEDSLDETLKAINLRRERKLQGLRNEDENSPAFSQLESSLRLRRMVASNRRSLAKIGGEK